MWWESWLDSGRIPDRLIRAAISALLRKRLRDEKRGGVEAISERRTKILERAHAGPVAVETEAANRQHYEVPAEFFEVVLGRRLKYSSGLWTPRTMSLDQAEENMLALYVQRAKIKDGQTILELGCGWGSLSLYLAEHFPAARIVGVSNSHGQRLFITERARARGLQNLEIITADMNVFEPQGKFDRIVSIEMFEHMTAHAELMRRISTWLHPDGLVFLHVFAHHFLVYPFLTEGADDWMGRWFFSGGIMPSFDYLPVFHLHLELIDQWMVSGTHYGKTAEAWLENLDRHRARVMATFSKVYGTEAAAWCERWRVFFMACAELWNFRGGNEWIVAHYLFRPRGK